MNKITIICDKDLFMEDGFNTQCFTKGKEYTVKYIGLIPPRLDGSISVKDDQNCSHSLGEWVHHFKVVAPEEPKAVSEPKTNFRIVTQYFDENGKAKGYQEFTVKMDLYAEMYDQDNIVKAIKAMIVKLDEKWAGHHRYVDHSPVFHDPIAFDQEEFNKIYESLCKENQQST
jgi:hypothetical protein